MTLTTNPVDGETGELRGVHYRYILAQKRWDPVSLVATNTPGSIDTNDLALGAVEPNNVNLSVISAANPPAPPSVGPLYLITAPASGAWAGHENQLATWNGAGWQYTNPTEGIVAWDTVGKQLLAWNGTAWVVANQFVLPARLEDAESIASADSITKKGTYYIPATATNGGPTADQYIIEHYPFPGVTNSFDVQWATLIDGNSTEDSHLVYFRSNNGGVQGTWYRANMTQAEMDARYARLSAGSSVSGASISFNVLDRNLSAPPGSPAVGDMYLVAPTGSGAWAGKDYQFAQWNGTAWDFQFFTEGKLAWIADEDVLISNNGATFVQIYPQTATAAANGTIIASGTYTMPSALAPSISSQNVTGGTLAVAPGAVGPGAASWVEGVVKFTFTSAPSPAYHVVHAFSDTGGVTLSPETVMIEAGSFEIKLGLVSQPLTPITGHFNVTKVGL